MGYLTREQHLIYSTWAQVSTLPLPVVWTVTSPLWTSVFCKRFGLVVSRLSSSRHFDFPLNFRWVLILCLCRFQITYLVIYLQRHHIKGLRGSLKSWGYMRVSWLEKELFL